MYQAIRRHLAITKKKISTPRRLAACFAGEDVSLNCEHFKTGLARFIFPLRSIATKWTERHPMWLAAIPRGKF